MIIFVVILKGEICDSLKPKLLLLLFLNYLISKRYMRLFCPNYKGVILKILAGWVYYGYEHIIAVWGHCSGTGERLSSFGDHSSMCSLVTFFFNLVYRSVFFSLDSFMRGYLLFINHWLFLLFFEDYLRFI